MEKKVVVVVVAVLSSGFCFTEISGDVPTWMQVYKTADDPSQQYSVGFRRESTAPVAI